MGGRRPPARQLSREGGNLNKGKTKPVIVQFFGEVFQTTGNNTLHSTDKTREQKNKRTMKVLIHYEDNESNELFKSLKITLPKSWKNGPTSKLLGQFVESYNGIEKLGGSVNPLIVEEMHLAMQQKLSDTSDTTELVALPSDAIVINLIPDRMDLYVQHGKSQTVEEIETIKQEAIAAQKKHLSSTVACTRFGCKIRFPPGGPFQSKCTYHKSPPVFHETAKFWSCCPNKKAYDWDEFQSIPGCCTSDTCTDVKEENQKTFLGGMDLRDKKEGPKLKSIDDFNNGTEESADTTSAAPVLHRLRDVLKELDIDHELFDQVAGIVKQKVGDNDEAVTNEIGMMLKSKLKSFAAESMRIS